MKLTIDRDALAPSLHALARVAARRTTIPIPAHMLLRAEQDRLLMKATDLDLEIVTQIPVEVSKKGAVMLSAHMAHDIVGKLPKGAQISLEANEKGGRVALRSGRSRFSIGALAPEDYPDIAAGEMTHHFTLPARNLAALIAQTEFAISTEETRYYLKGIFLHEKDGALFAVATDGHRLARAHVDAPAGAAGMPGIIVPRKTVAEIAKMVDGQDERDVSLSLSQTKIRCAMDETVLTSKLIDGTFPDYQRVIPSGNDKIATLDREAFMAAVDRVATIVSERGRAVKCDFAKARLTLSITNPDSGEAVEEIEADYDGPALAIGFNAKYLTDILGVFEKADRVTVRLAEPGSPTIIQAGSDDLLTVLMPMRV